jgi:glycosyltransferase involved in cell wall biosynthesis
LKTVIDVIIPFHKNNNYLKSAILSIKKSKDVDVRVIAINDSGTFVEPKLIGLSSPDLLIPTTGNGYLDALATGISLASSEFLAFQDSDDLTHPNRLKRQMSMIQVHGLDLVTGSLIRTNQNGKVTNNKSIFGSLPQFLSPREKLIFGPHGADSTIFGRTDFFKESWGKHRKFSPSFADYGWLLSVVGKARIAHEPEAHYFYRSHTLQMSRYATDRKGWGDIFDVWLANLLDICLARGFKQGEIDFLASLDSKVSIAIAFPSTLIKISESDKSKLRTAIELLKKLDSDGKSLESKVFNEMLHRRIFIVSRGRDFGSLASGIRMVWQLLLNLSQGLRPRRIH